MSDHEWCRDVSRDEAIRAAEDAAAVPSIQHRDLPEVVAALTERVARLEAAQATLGSGDVFADVGCGSTGDEIARLTAEITRLREERRWIPVTERLPDGNEWVDVAGPWGDSVGWYEPSGWRNVWPCEVTHWRKRGPGPGGEVEG